MRFSFQLEGERPRQRAIWLLVIASTSAGGWVNTSATQTAGPPTQTKSQPASGPPRCALIVAPGAELDGSPLVALLEVLLTQQQRVTLVERTEIDKVIHEAQLQVLFSPEGGGQRVALGRLLRADLLLLLRACSDKSGQRRLEVVICETGSGLRLRMSTLHGSENPEDDATKVAALLEQAIHKYRAPVRLIFAVPPFAGSDFLHKYDYLRRLCAGTIERWLIGQDGIVVVELAEAQAIAAELALTATQPAVARRLPYYLLGAYEIDKTGAQETISITLTLRHGQTMIDETRRTGIEVSQLIELLPRTAAPLVTKVTGRKSEATDPITESRQLVDRAETYCRSGDFEEALNLIETAALIRPDDPTLHFRAAELARLLIEDLSRKRAWYEPELQPGDPTEDFVIRAAMSLHYQRLISSHVRQWFDLVDLRNVPKSDLEKVMAGRPPLYGRKYVTEKVELEYHDSSQELADAHAEMILDVLEEKIAAGQVTASVLPVFRTFGGVKGLAEDSQGRARRFLHLIQDIPGAEYDIMGLCVSGINVWSSRSGYIASPDGLKLDEDLVRQLRQPSCQRAIEQVAAMPGISARKAVAKLRELTKAALAPRARLTDTERTAARRRFDDSKKHTSLLYRHGHYIQRVVRNRGAAKFPTTRYERATGGREVRFHEIAVKRVERDGTVTSDEALGCLIGALPCGPGVDVFWSSDEIFVMKQAGRVRSVLQCPGPHFQDPEGGPWPLSPFFVMDHAVACFDGRYVWLPARGADEPYLCVVDPVSEKAIRLTTADGLPPMQFGACAAAISPGRCFVAAAFGRPGNNKQSSFDRTWCGLVSLNQDARPSVRIIKELSRTHDTDGQPRKAPKDANAPFIPRWAYALHDPADPSRSRVILFRSGMKPLMIDPDTGSGTVIKHIGEGASQLTQVSDGILYTLDYHKLNRIGFPDFVSEVTMLHTNLYSTGEGTAQWAPGFMGDPPINLGINKGGIHFVAGGSWWFGPCCDRPARPLRGSLPPGLHYFDIVESRHYGLIVLAGEFPWCLRPMQVEIVPEVRQQVAEAVMAAEKDRAEEAIRREQYRKLVYENWAKPLDIGVDEQVILPWQWGCMAAIAAAGIFLVWRLRRTPKGPAPETAQADTSPAGPESEEHK